MRPAVHLAVGISGGLATYSFSGDLAAAAGFFFGSWLITDLDHILIYYLHTGDTNIKKMSQYHMVTLQNYFIRYPTLYLLPFHTIEFFALIFFLALGLGQNTLAWGLLFGMSLHRILDDIHGINNIGRKMHKIAHSVIEYCMRKYLFREKAFSVQDLRSKADS